MALTSACAVLSRVVSAAAALITVPLTVSYLGTERYGLWMTISSVITLLGFADLGIGNGLLNAIATSHGRDDRAAARRYVSSAFFLLVTIAAAIAVVFALSYPFVDWARVFNVTSPLARRESGPAVALFVVFLCLNLPLDTVQRVQQGYQEGFLSNIWSIVGSILSLIGLLVVTHLKGGLPWLVLAMSGAPTVAVLVNWIAVFGWNRRWLLPSLRALDLAAAREVATSGALFFVLTIFSLFALSSDNFVIAHVISASAVAAYAVTQKVFLTAQVSQYFIAPLWPAFGEAMARHDYLWARRTLLRALAVSCAVAVVTAVPLVLFGRALIVWWAGPSVAPSFGLLLGFGVWIVLAGYVGAMSMFLNGSGLLRHQLGFYGAAAVAAVLLKIALARWVGTAGVIWGTIIAFGVFHAGPAARVAFRHLSMAARRQARAAPEPILTD